MRLIQLSMLILAVLVLSVSSCKKKSSSSSSTDATTATATDTTTATTVTDSITTSTTSALPGDLAIASNTEAVSTASASQMAASGTTKKKQDPKSKKDRLKKAQNPTVKADCFLALAGGGAPMNSPTCYGPQLYYTKHPDHATPTSGASTVTGTQAGAGPNSASGTLPGGDLGLWTAAESDGTACAAAKMNSVVQSAAESIDLAVGAAGAMLCVAKMGKKTMPDVGKTLDLTTTMSGDADVKAKMTVTAATITREANTAAGRPVYTSKLEMAITPPGSTTSNSMSVTLRHVPLDDKNETYKGLMTMSRTVGSGKPPKPPEPPKTAKIAGPSFQLAAGDINAVSVVYAKDAKTLTYKVVSANYASTVTAATIFNSTTGEVDASKAGSSNQATDGWKGNLNVMVGTSDAVGDGSLAIAWQAGPQDGYTRNFNASTATNADSTRTGTAYFGFAKNVSNKAPKLAIGGMICNWAGPSNKRDTSAGWSLVQKQTMKLNSTTGIWAPVTSNITFAPTNSCNWVNATDSTYSTSAISAAATKGAVTNNLVTKASGYTFTVPTAPTAP